MKVSFNSFVAAGALLFAAQGIAQVTFYEGEGFRGRAFTTNSQQTDFRRSGFNDKASSVVVDGGRWEVCEDASYQGRCVVIRKGSYDSLKRMGVNNRISSVRRVSDRRKYDNESPEPLAEPNYDYRRRSNEKVYEAKVTSARAVMSDSSAQRCWAERDQVQRKGDRNIAGGVIGGIIGGVLGHQVGSGSGNDVATVGGAIAGAAIGSNQNRGRDGDRDDLRRCESVHDGAPEYWDVRYKFRNVEHRVQMSEPPGPTVYVNSRGEPRQ